MSERRFFVFSLPRSGSSWLSVFLGGAGSYCYHDPLADGGWLALDDRLRRRPEPCAGAIDTSAHQRPTPSLKDTQYYVLRRDPSAILSSLRRRGWIMSLNLELEKLDNSAKACGAIDIHHKWLGDLDYLKSIWHSVTGNEKFDRERAEYLMEMNIQREFAAVRKRVLCNTSR